MSTSACEQSTLLQAAILRFGARPGSLQDAARHHLTQPGKRTRAGLLLRLCNGHVQADAALAAAAACELIHEASIVHDDLQDRAERRRRQPAVWALFGEDTALLLGDQLIVSAFSALAEAARALPGRGHELIDELAEAVYAAADGQHGQLMMQADAALSRDGYERHAGNKTGRLLALPLVLAALLRGASPRQVSQLKTCGLALGIAYQILNDLRPIAEGWTARSEDLRNRTIAAPVVVAQERAPDADPFMLIASGAVDGELQRRCWLWLTDAAERGLSALTDAPADMRAGLGGFAELQLLAPAAVLAPRNLPRDFTRLEEPARRDRSYA